MARFSGEDLGLLVPRLAEEWDAKWEWVDAAALVCLPSKSCLMSSILKALFSFAEVSEFVGDEAPANNGGLKVQIFLLSFSKDRLTPTKAPSMSFIALPVIILARLRIQVCP